MALSYSRLQGDSRIEQVRKKGAVRFGRCFRVRYLAKKDGESACWAIATSSRKWRKAVERNRVRRRARAAIRSATLGIGFDAVLEPQHAITQAPFFSLIEEINGHIVAIKGSRKNHTGISVRNTSF